ncbi:MAG: L,D-transpeptidase [Pseudomonadota bacterium]
MTVKTMNPLSAIAVTVLSAAVFVSATAPAAMAQQRDAGWGGTSEYGGDRQTVNFAKSYRRGQIIVSFADRRLYLVTRPGEALSYPIAVPKEDARWEGRTTVSMKRKNPAWRPTQNMLRKNPRLPSWVPGGHPMNPLGVRALYLGTSAYRIHGTDAPWTIGTAASSGCIRMFNKDVLDLYPRVNVGAKVQVTWKSYRPKQRYSSYEDKPQRSNRRRMFISRY